MGSQQPFDEHPAEQLRENMDGQEEIAPARSPARAIVGKHTTEDKAMDVGVMGQRLPPGVQDTDEAKLAAQTMTRIGSDGLDRHGDGFEENAIEQPLVLVGDLRNCAGHGKYDMEIGNGQKVSFAIGKPLVAGGTLALRAVPVAAGVIGDTRVRAVIAGLDMPTKRRRLAQLDRGHDAAFHPAEVAVVNAGIGMAMTAEDIRHLQLAAHGGASGGWHHLKGQAIKRACAAAIVVMATCV